MSNELESEMKMEDIDQLFERDKTKKIIIVLGVLTLLIFIISGMSKGSTRTGVGVAAATVAAPVVVRAVDTISVTSGLSEGFGVAMSNVDNLLREFV